MNRNLIALALTFLCGIPAALAESESEKFHALLAQEWEYSMTEFPEFSTYVGRRDGNHRWTDQSLEALPKWESHDRELLDRVKKLERDKLDHDDQVHYDLFLNSLELNVAGQRFQDEYLPVNQMGGVQQSIASTVNRMPANNLEDFENIVARLESAATPIEQSIAKMRWGLEKDVTPPAITLRDVPMQIMNQIVDDPADSPAMRPFERFPASIAQEDRDRLLAAAKTAIEERIVPAYRKMHAFMVNEYLPGARDDIAASSLPDGDAWYAHSIRVRTTTDLTPQEIHDIGLSEVARIRGEMARVIKDSGFEGTFDEFNEFLRTDPQFYFTSKEELLAAYRDIAKRADPELYKLFGTLPRVPYGIKAVPTYAEKSQTTAYYQPGSPMAGRPGYFYANTYALDTRPKWEMEALTLHEAVPGHHLQLSISQEMEGVPEFRKWRSYTAFVEGWGLYAESLGEEMGFYQDPYSKYGQLTYEIWRAIRLVVDTGMHSLGWTREQAIDYFAANTGKQLHDITVEVDRYIVWPGQALAYKLGELKFKELRARSEAALGDQFDIREFHDELLKNGAIPLDVVDAQIEDWLKRKKSES